MTIDFHTHTFPDRMAANTIARIQGMCHSAAFCDGTAVGLRASMAEAGIGCSVVLPVATNPLKVSSINDVSIASTGADGLIYFGCMHPDCPDWRGELGRIASAGLKGIKIHPVYQDVDIDDIRFLRILGRAAELGLIVAAHSGADIGFPGAVRCSPAMAANALRQVGEVNLILAHMGGWKNWEEAELLASTSACIDTAFALGEITPLDDGYYTSPEQLKLLDGAEFLRILRLFGSKRVFFGTDSPWDSQRGCLERILALPLSGAERYDVLEGNARRALGI